ncbi:MAG: phosphoribosylglycinamide formyltransferase [Bacteroidia bacterium]|nr:phosphoribosylglycinamide formyltransferase [Bacteroidia bacterium]
MYRIAILGSGKGSNARNLIEHFKDNPHIQVQVLVSDKPRRGFLDISYDYRINLEIIKGPELADAKWLNRFRMKYRPDLIVLAGYLKLIPTEMIQAFQGKIINLHPSLLPKFGGKGMYGSNVHQAVLQAGETESGITVHYVNEQYDQGQVIRQEKCTVEPGDTVESLAHKIHQLEHSALPEVIQKLAVHP